MKEKFRSWQPKGNLKIKYCKDKAEGTFAYWETSLSLLYEQVDTVVREYIDIGIKLTSRQLFYQLVGKVLIPSSDEVYKRLCIFLTQCRYAGLIDWSAIEDRDRIPSMHAQWKSVLDLVDSAVYSYRLPRWQDQEYYVEMYCEKKAGISVLKPVADKWHIHFGFNKGYSSASSMYDLAKRLMEQIKNGKKAIILYFGDHDPSGIDMIRDIHQRMCEFLLYGKNTIDIVGDDGVDDPNFRVVPVVLTGNQIKEYNLPPNPAKVTDPRAGSYIKRYGRVSWELDSLNALELRKIAERSVLKYLDRDKYRVWVKREEKEIQALKDFGAGLSDNG